MFQIHPVHPVVQISDSSNFLRNFCFVEEWHTFSVPFRSLYFHISGYIAQVIREPWPFLPSTRICTASSASLNTLLWLVCVLICKWTLSSSYWSKSTLDIILLDFIMKRNLFLYDVLFTISIDNLGLLM